MLRLMPIARHWNCPAVLFLLSFAASELAIAKIFVADVSGINVCRRTRHDTGQAAYECEVPFAIHALALRAPRRGGKCRSGADEALCGHAALCALAAARFSSRSASSHLAW